MPNSKPGGPVCLSLYGTSLNRRTQFKAGYIEEHVPFRLNIFMTLNQPSFTNCWHKEWTTITHTIRAKYLKISKLQYQLQLLFQETIFNNQMHYDLLFILQAHKMKSWLLILGAVIMLLNLPADLACKNIKYFNVSQ